LTPKVISPLCIYLIPIGIEHFAMGQGGTVKLSIQFSLVSFLYQLGACGVIEAVGLQLMNRNK
jgi:hypothetical protein